MNILLNKKAQNQTSFGTFTQFKSTAAVECLGSTGLDYIIIDSEHSTMDSDFIYQAIIAADAAGAAPIVRINGVDRKSVLHPLDAGAAGLIVPAIETVDQVKQLINWAKFTPVGSRGYAPTRDARWGAQDLYAEGGIQAYMERCNKETLVLPQCETVGCLEHIEEICALEGLDGIFVGPLDLSIALGKPLQVRSPEVLSAIDRVLKACKANGKLTLTYANNVQEAREYVAMGFDSVALGLDMLFLANTYRGMVKELKG